MKKQNVIDLAAYREELSRRSSNIAPKIIPAPALTISDELKTAIESLIVRLRATDNIK